MKNYWLDKKKACNKRWIAWRSTYGHTIELHDYTCEKSNDTLEKLEATFDFTIDLTEDIPKQVKH